MTEKAGDELDRVEVVSSQDTGLSSTVPTKLENPTETESNHVNEAKTLRKIDLRIVPMVTLFYLLSWLDRGYDSPFAHYENGLNSQVGTLETQRCSACKMTLN